MSDPVTPPAAPASAAAEDRTVAILTYVTLIGFIIAIVLHGNKRPPSAPITCARDWASSSPRS